MHNINSKQQLKSKSAVVFFIGFVFPEPKSSAAGARIIQLIQLFKTQGYTVVFGSASKRTEHSFDLESIGVQEENLVLNDVRFDNFVEQLNPHIVVFDRFMTEEQFGWRISKCCPQAIRILDTEDLHFLRKARQEYKVKTSSFSKEYLKTDVAKRELASILRSDLSLIISEVEMDILTTQLHIDSSLLLYLPFVLDGNAIPDVDNLIPFEQRRDFVFVGNFIHPPNSDTVFYLKTDIWPKLHKILPDAALHVYGAYTKPKHLNLQNKKQKFFVHGYVDDIDEVLSSAKILLAPLQFGAGLKGKLVDAMRNGTPCAMSSIAAEGVFGKYPRNGFVSDDETVFIENAIELYTNKDLWLFAQSNGIAVLQQRFLKDQFALTLFNTIQYLKNHLDAHRLQNFTGILLQHHSMQSTKYFSKWIEAKNKGI